jgi:signal transduction histidine kinase
MRTRSRLLAAFLGAHLALSVLVGALLWWWQEGAMRSQAEQAARAVGSVVARGGFALNPHILERMRALSGHDFHVLDQPAALRPGTVQVAENGVVVEVDYRTPAWQERRRELLWGTAAAVAAGSLLFAGIAALIARRLAAPLERLAGAARAIGDGGLDRPVPPVGDGEVGALARELEAMRARLVELDRRHRQDERLATLGLFTATIAHEVRNPLSAVRLTVQLAARAPGADARLAPLTDELDRLDLTVDELLGFARGMNVERQPCDLAEVAADVLRLLRRQADHAGIALVLVPAPPSPSPASALVQADPRRLRQLLLNLLLNALQARRDGRAASRVVVELAVDGFAVADDGPGVDPALVPRLFDAFTSDRVGGTGLGLNLARAIAEAHGATLSYEPGNPGARFVLRGLVAAVPG